MIFIDGSNFYHCAKMNLGRTDIDFHRLGQKLTGDRKLIRIYYYNVALDQEEAPEKSREQDRFFQRLRETPYITIKLGRLVRKGGTRFEKGIDVKIAVDLVSHCYRDTYDTAVLVSGDSDLVSAVEEIKRSDKHIELAFFHKGLSPMLREACDRHVPLTRHWLEGCIIGHHGRGSRESADRRRSDDRSRSYEEPSPMDGEEEEGLSTG